MVFRGFSAWFRIALTGFALLSGNIAAGQEGPESGEGAQASFNIWEFRVAGNSLLDSRQIERTVYPYLGPGKSIDDVEGARVALETLFKNSGYPTVVVNIPEQNVSNGIVKLEVVEGRVDRLRISGSRYFSLGRIRERVPALAEGEVPYVPDVQEQLQTLNQASGDRGITPIFRPGRTPGTVEVELRVKDELPLHATFEVNDRYSQDTSRLRASVTARYANLWQKEHSFSLQAQTSPQSTDDVKVLAGTYVMPLENQHTLALYAVATRSDVATAGDLTVLGDGNIFGTRYIIPMPPAQGYFHSFTMGFDYKDFDENVRPIGGENLNTAIDYMNLTSQYQATRFMEHDRLSFSLGANFGVRGLFNSPEEFELKRFNSRPNYFALNSSLDFIHDLDSGSQLRLAFSGQLAGGPLVSNEQFSAGGADTVRGYYESQILGDDGIQGSFEFLSPSYAKHLSEKIRSLRLYAFVDGAKVRVQDPLPGQAFRQELYGTGLGLRMQGPAGLKAELSWGWALHGIGTVEEGDSRGHFMLEYSL